MTDPFWQRGVLAVGRHALVRLPVATERECDGGACQGGTRHRAAFAVSGPWPAGLRNRDPFRAGQASALSTRGSGRGVKPVPAWDGADLTWRGEVRVDACGPGREASPPRRPVADGSVPSATVRDPALGPTGLHLRQDQAARQATCPRRRAPSPLPFPRCPRLPSAVAGRAGAGLDPAGRAERPSSRTHGRAAPGNANRSRPARRHPGRSTRNRG